MFAGVFSGNSGIKRQVSLSDGYDELRLRIKNSVSENISKNNTHDNPSNLDR